MSLQNLCLNAIVENFSKYYDAYWNSGDINLRRKFEFLQRIYAQQIATKLFEEFEIEEKHADFVFNKYLNDLDAKWFENCSWNTVVSKMAEIGPEIKKIILKRSKKRPWHEVLSYLPNLEVLHYRGHCVDEIIKGLSKYCPQIQEIKMGSAEYISDGGIKFLCKVKKGRIACSNLKKILIGDYYMPEESAEYLVTHLPSLEVFGYKSLHEILYNLHRTDLPTIERVASYKFTKLDLTSAMTSPHFDDLLKICLSLCPNLKSLVCLLINPQQLELITEFSCSEITDLNLTFSCRTRSIHNTWLWDFQAYLDVNDFLKLKGRKLTSLRLCKCSVSLRTLAEYCPNVNGLHLIHVDVDSGDSSVLPFQNLEAFTYEISEDLWGLPRFLMERRENFQSVCSILQAFPKLESMSLANCDLSDAQVKAAILKCCEQSPVKKMCFAGCAIGDQLIFDILFACHSLRSFKLLSCGYAASDKMQFLRCLEQLPNKPEISFSGPIAVREEEFEENDNDDDDDFDFDMDYSSSD